MKTSKVYHGVKGERITVDQSMVERQNKRQKLLHCAEYDRRNRRGYLYAVLFCAVIVLVCTYAIVK